MTCPARARIDLVLTTAVRLNVSGLSRVDRCCGQAMMRSARKVLRKWFVQSARFFVQSLRCAGRLFRHHYPEPRFQQAGALRLWPDLVCCRWHLVSQ